MAGQAEAACPPWGSRGLLAVAILSSCFLLTQAQEIPVKVDPSRPLQGRNVTLTPGGDPSFIQCTWHRGARLDSNMISLFAPAFTPPLLSKGPQFTGREGIGPDCSLHISNLTLNDTGIYSVSKTTRDGPQTGSVSMQVFATPPPEGPDSGLSAGAIVGIVIGCLVGVVLIVLVLYFALKSTTLGAKRTYNIPH